MIGVGRMKINERKPPRIFTAGPAHSVSIKHAADIQLESNEQVTFLTESGTEFDVVKKEWGYYATPSMNTRLREHGLRAALVSNQHAQLYLLLVEFGCESEFLAYLSSEKHRLLIWLDSDSNVNKIINCIDNISVNASE